MGRQNRYFSKKLPPTLYLGKLCLEFALIVLVVVYLNRWIQRKPKSPDRSG